MSDSSGLFFVDLKCQVQDPSFQGYQFHLKYISIV